MVTIKDVAQAANVAPSTVSRVISGNNRISDTTRVKVLSVMKELGYQPNHAARTLVTKQSKTIGIIQKSGRNETRQNPFIIDVLSGVYKTCKAHGYATISTTSEQYQNIELEVKQMISYHAVDGFILLYSRENDMIENLLSQYNMPYVVVGKTLSNQQVIHIDNDNVEASEQLTRYLVSLGHTDFLFLAERGNYEVIKDRIKGFSSVLKQYAQIGRIEYFDMNYQSIKSYFYHLILHNALPSVIITSDTMLNHIVLSVLYELQLHVPTDLQTATFNDSYLTEFAAPPQTVVDIHPDLLGEAAGDSIIQLISDEHIIDFNKVIPTDIIKRASTQQIKKEQSHE
ncbi:LacI family DNA-binding transcriptional regulator [Staphylococcus equorum]|uniref:LacI family DNA-binding transcriptional regulator n=1 Tax=Staphylococcus equorum TaxID=246432 RepID=A0A9X4L765_9STAP|nr:LacI family DNA-binding transcriptional regulator [Staphylococcus equorum]MDG0842507.1 LacI family DNA-binding transcriptional regulator [Staphylococcus equorum]MDG0858361.1 LacI family DNA-binding transcriptional regulator [Staphylococcus equorum]